MPHLATFRKGWESENLARYILHKFSFLAQPTNIADDVGADFFCTLFQIQKEDSHEYMLPKNSFAIQVKSNSRSFDVSEKIEYLNNLEIPFFVGVVNRTKLKLTIYSGEFIPFLFSEIGLPKKLSIGLCDSSSINESVKFCRKVGDDSYVVLFPCLTEIAANINRDKLKIKVEKIGEVCSIIQDNIASKRNHEYIFTQYGKSPKKVTIYAGPGSVKEFRENFLSRLTEVFYNLNWIYQNSPMEFNMKEFSIYADLFYHLKDLRDGQLPLYLTGVFDELKSKVDKELGST